ncbi:MAG: hypothetical protein JZU65_00675 [Chlorobium sp.]|jgi:hypothetical protein|nr:hypothetical protein [Chlorobium sp.]
MATGTPKVIGFAMAANRPIDEWSLNEAAPWADKAAALAGIPLGSRSPGQRVNINMVPYWFNLAMDDLVAEPSLSDPDAEDVSIADTGGLFDANNVEDALAEVKTQADATDAAIALLDGDQATFRINLTAQSSVAARVAAATETTDYPTGWTLAADSSVNLLVSHTLTGRNIAGVEVFEIDGATERLLVPFSSAYSGVLGNTAGTVLIEGLAPTLKAIRIFLTFY